MCLSTCKCGQEVNFRCQFSGAIHFDFSFDCFETKSHAAQAGLGFTIFKDDLGFQILPMTPEYWDYKHTPLHHYTWFIRWYQPNPGQCECQASTSPNEVHSQRQSCFFLNIIHLLCACACMHACTKFRGQLPEKPFSPATTRAMGTEQGPQAWPQAFLPTDLTHQPPTLFFETVSYWDLGLPS